MRSHEYKKTQPLGHTKGAREVKETQTLALLSASISARNANQGLRREATTAIQQQKKKPRARKVEEENLHSRGLKRGRREIKRRVEATDCLPITSSRKKRSQEPLNKRKRERTAWKLCVPTWKRCRPKTWGGNQERSLQKKKEERRKGGDEALRGPKGSGILGVLPGTQRGPRRSRGVQGRNRGRRNSGHHNVQATWNQLDDKGLGKQSKPTSLVGGDSSVTQRSRRWARSRSSLRLRTGKEGRCK